MKKFILTLLIVLLVKPAHADCWLPEYLPTIINTTTVDLAGDLIKVNATTIHLFYTQSTLRGSGQNKVMKRTFNIPTRSWSEPTEVYTESGKNLGGGRGGVIGSNIYLFIRRANTAVTTFEDVVMIKSTDLNGTSWSAPTVVHTFGSGHRGNADMGRLVPTGVAGEYIHPIYYHVANGFESDVGSWYAGYIKTTDSGTTWATDIDAVYGPPDGVSYALGEQSFAYVGNNTIVAIFRDSLRGPIRQSVSTDSGDTWSDADTGLTNLTPTTLNDDKEVNLYYDTAIDRLFAIFHDRGTQQSRITYNDPDDIISNPLGWRPPDTIASGFKFWGYTGMEKVNTDLYLVFYSRTPTGLTMDDNDFYWGLYKIGDCFDPGSATCGDLVISPGEQCDNDAVPASGDGCSSTCQLETATCGNGGSPQAGEECDDGNTASGDGCSSTCQIEDTNIPTEFNGLVIE